MVAADGEQVAVAGYDDDLCVRLGQLEPRGKRQRPAVRGVEGIQADVAGHAAGAADAGNHGDIVGIPAGVLDGVNDGGKHRPDAAAGAPDVGNPLRPEEGIHRMRRQVFCGFCCNHNLPFAALAIELRISPGCRMAPP